MGFVYLPACGSAALSLLKLLSLYDFGRDNSTGLEIEYNRVGPQRLGEISTLSAILASLTPKSASGDSLAINLYS